MTSKETRIGMKKLVLISVLLLAAVLAAFFFYFFPAEKEGVEAQVIVFGGREKLDGALVQLLDAGKVIARGETKNGVVDFRNLPERIVVVKAFKKGFGEKSGVVDLRETRSLKMQLAEPNFFTGGLSVSVVNEESGEPVDGALIEYAFGSISGKTVSDKRGIASINVSAKSLVHLKVSRAGFEADTFSFIASKQSILIKLREKKTRKTALKATLAGAAEKERVGQGSILVNVFDEGGELVEEGTARVYDSETNWLIAEIALFKGSAFVSGLPLGSKVYVTVEAKGFLPYDGAANPVLVEENSFLEITLAKESEGVETVLRVVDENGITLQAQLMVFDSSNNLLAASDSLGEWKTRLAPGTYYAVAFSQGFALGQSSFFQAGDSVEIVLVKENSPAIAVLKVKTIDEEGRALSNVSVRVLTREEEAEKQAGVQKQANALGETEFFLLKGKEYVVEARYLNEVTRKTIFLSEDALVELQLDVDYGFLHLKAVDAVSHEEVKVNLSVLVEGKKTTECVSPCRIKIKAFAKVLVAANAAGYLEFKQDVELVGGESREVTAFLVPQGEIKGPWVQFLGFYDASGRNASVLQAGKSYRARMRFGSTSEVEWIGASLRIGGKESVAEESAGIYSFPQATRVFKSAFFKPAEVSACGDLVEEKTVAHNGLWKWVELRYDDNAVHETEFVVKVKENASGKIEVFYRAYSISDGVFSRVPFDEELESNESSEFKAGCHANSFKQEFKIATPKPGAPPKKPIQVRTEFTENARVWLNKEKNRFESNAREIILQIDSILPADAMPLEIDVGEDCSLFYEFDSTHKQCFGYDVDEKRIWFKSHELNSACEIAVEANAVENASATLSVGASCTRSVLSIPVKVTANEAESVYGVPDALTPGNNSVRLFYAVNEKQAGQRLMKLRGEFGEKTVSVKKPGVQTIAWSGGLLQLLEGNSLVKEWFYENAASFFPNKGDVGSRATSCADYKCCASNWCNPKAFAQAFEYFKKTAAAVARATAFRRGDGEPMRYLLRKPFEYVAVFQLVEGAQDFLKANARVFLEGGCSASNPAVFELKAESEDGEEWNYSAQTLLLEDNLLQPSNRIALCGFLHGENKSIVSTNASTIASSEQASDSHATPLVVPSFFAPVTPIAVQCKAADAAVKASKTAVEAAYATAAIACSAVTVGEPVEGITCETKVNALKSMHAAYIGCLDTGKTASACFQESFAEDLMKLFSGDGACAACGGAYYSAIDLEASAERACDSLRGVYADFPGILPVRTSNAQCFARGDGCRLTCEPKQSFVQVLTFQNQLYCVVHAGINAYCAPQISSLTDSVKTVVCSKVNALASLSSLASTPNYLTSVVGVFKASNNPFAASVESLKPFAKIVAVSKAQAIANELVFARQPSLEGIRKIHEEIENAGVNPLDLGINFFKK